MFIPVELELSKGGVGDLRRSCTEVPKPIIAGTVPGAAVAPVSVMPGLCSGAGGGVRLTCTVDGSCAGLDGLFSSWAVFSTIIISALVALAKAIASNCSCVLGAR